MITAILCMAIIGWIIYGLGWFLAIAIVAGMLLGILAIYNIAK
jgi:hypothetical protein